ncbi:sterile alpha motif domain-containing protein 7 [Dromiciops gliroides]|uniref:sterile alpha motif domain-containing protein 7 n=1 Tax=Dromiciops gliroides TaxID=33562 RepID=UPI001CC5D1AE|nr:sterile alpha motif domain-containing protein 7 [Dromiciops gliroides]
MRNPLMTVNPSLIGSGPQRIQSVPSQFEARFVDRDSLPSADVMAPPDLRQIHIASRLGASVPPHVNMPHVLSNTVYPGYSFLQPESMEAVARRQELVQKHNLARMEMEMGTIFQQREIGKAQHKGLMGLGLETSFLYQHGIPTSSVSFRGRSRLPEVHLPNDLYVHRSSLDDLHSNTGLITTGPYPPVSSWQKEKGRRLGRRMGNHKASGCSTRSSKSQEEDKNPDQSITVSAAEKEDKKDLDIEPHPKYEPSQSDGEPTVSPTKSLKEHEHGSQKPCEEHGWSIGTNDNGGGNGKDSCHSSSASDGKYLFHSPKYYSDLRTTGFQMAKGAHDTQKGTSDLFLNGEDLSSVEDIRKWAVDDVYDFITGLPGCSDYAQIFRDHAIDGETLPLLTEEHLLDTMGLKLGPALKIRSQEVMFQFEKLHFTKIETACQEDLSSDPSPNTQ